MRYEWLLKMYQGDSWPDVRWWRNPEGNINAGKCIFRDNKFEKFYHVMLYQDMVSQCLKILFENNHVWMTDVILEYLFIEDIDRLIYDIYEGNADEDEDEEDESFPNHPQSMEMEIEKKMGPFRYWYPYSYDDITFDEFIPVMSKSFALFLGWNKQNPSISKLYDL